MFVIFLIVFFILLSFFLSFLFWAVSLYFIYVYLMSFFWHAFILFCMCFCVFRHVFFDVFCRLLIQRGWLDAEPASKAKNLILPAQESLVFLFACVCPFLFCFFILFASVFFAFPRLGGIFWIVWHFLNLNAKKKQ